MAKRSLRASSSGIKKAKHTFARKGWTQEYLANDIGIKTRQPIWRFFAGQAIERYTFFEICTRLDLDWREIALDPPVDYVDLETESDGVEPTGIDSLVQMVRSQRREKINNQCGILQLLDINHPVSIDQIYIDVNILEQIASQQWLEVSEINSLQPEDIDRYGVGKIADSQISGMQAIAKHNKLRVLGRPGAGKSTFLKYLAMQCNREQLVESKVPVFIALREFAEAYRDSHKINFLEFIQQEFITSDISRPSILKKLLQDGRMLILIDGMDEVNQDEEHSVMGEIRRFCEKYHKNQFVASCRTASQRLALRGFTDVEVAPLTQEQITIFSQKWFAAFRSTPRSDDITIGKKFIDKLEVSENWRFRRMITTPLFLHLACSIFNRQGKFPTKQSEFYKQGMDLLLGKWDEVAGVERDQVHRGFLLPQKLKLLSNLAAATFEKGLYFFEQSTIEQCVAEFLQSMPSASDDAEEIQQASVAILKGLESQNGLLAERARGIFSFSYLALQEYFTARKIVASHNVRMLGESLQDLVDHITDPHWREIFLLTSSMLLSADGLMQLMKQQIDAIVAEDPYLQNFLGWASQKSGNNPSPKKSATGRAFYLALTRTSDLSPDVALACTLDQGEFLDAALDDLLKECLLSGSKDFAYVHACGEALGNILGIVLDIGFHKSLQKLSDQLPNKNHTEESFNNWCQKNYGAWLKNLQIAIASHRNISSEWEFNDVQKRTLQRYYEANQLLLDCLNGDCEVTAIIREEIEATLLLPQQEIERREWA